MAVGEGHLGPIGTTARRDRAGGEEVLLKGGIFNYFPVEIGNVQGFGADFQLAQLAEYGATLAGQAFHVAAGQDPQQVFHRPDYL
jgi:hypothetical protein